jgi:ATP-dependent DNA helicase RecQ
MQKLCYNDAMDEWKQQAERVLRQALGDEAAFREGQWESIRSLLAARARLLVVQRTGWGKSVVYFVATRLQRDRGGGPTLLVSPLLALMRNQREFAARFGVRAESVDSSNVERWEEVFAKINEDRVDVLLVSPERLGNERFRREVLVGLERRIGLLVIDEAHCISDWGHDFRPDYRRILQTVARLPDDVPILATTATANDRVVADIGEQMGERLEVVRGTLMRESLRIRALELPSQAERLAWLASYLPRLTGTGIVYTATVNDAQRVAAWLRQNGIEAAAYYGALDPQERERVEKEFDLNAIDAIVATTALGMGYDKPDVGFVVHFQRPGSIIAYYQQIGRAGRAVPRAEVVLLTGYEDDEIVEHFIASAFPPPECFDSILEALARGPSSRDKLAGCMNFRMAQVEKALQLLEVEGAIERRDNLFRLCDAEWRFERLRADRIRDQRRLEHQQMREYTASTDCRMAFLARALDSICDPCGRCDRCRPSPPPRLSPESVAEAAAFLRRGHIVIEPKKMWPAGFVDERRRRIVEEERLCRGFALSVYNDAGWGYLVRQGKYELGRFPDELLAPCTKLLEAVDPRPEWLAWVPGKRPLVEEFARRLSGRLQIEAVEAVRKVRENRPQKEMQNSAHQLANVWSAFEVVDARPGPGVLLDDVVDSGWTLAAIGAMLRRRGSGPIMPFALASARPREEV